MRGVANHYGVDQYIATIFALMALVLMVIALAGCGPSAEEVIARGYSQCITYAEGDKVEEMRCDIQREGALNRQQQYAETLMLMSIP